MDKIKKDFQNCITAENQQKQVIVDLQEKLDIAISSLQNIQTRKRDVGIQYFTKEKRANIVTHAAALGYSAEEIKQMKPFLDEAHWNQDEIEIENGILTRFQNAEDFINDYETHTPLLINILSSLGKLVKDNKGEENNDN